MRTGFQTLAIVGIAAAVAVYAVANMPSASNFHSNVLTHQDMEFLKYVSKYGKSYGTKEEFEFRADQFKENLAKIMEENSKNDNTFTLAVNKFADMTRDEYKQLLSYKPVRGGRQAEVQDFAAVDAIPSEIDWRTRAAVNPVQDQRQCGSCWAFSAVGALESRFQIKTGPLVKLSEQQLVDCDNADGNMGCNGGDMYLAFKYIAANGIETEQNYPYKGVDQNCAYDKSKAQVKNIGQAYVAPNNAEALKTAIADGPVSVAIEADTFVFQFYSGGILNSKACGTNLDHGVVAVGYVATDANPYYIVRNSWGASWGVKGYINIAIKDGQGICGIQMEPVIPIF